MIQHVVMFSLSDTLSEREKYDLIVQIQKESEQLKKSIHQIVNIEVHANINPEEKYDLLLSVLLPDMGALKTYTDHPAHRAMQKVLLAPNVAERACIDYFLPNA